MNDTRISKITIDSILEIPGFTVNGINVDEWCSNRTYINVHLGMSFCILIQIQKLGSISSFQV